jgi:uncharacterized protein
MEEILASIRRIIADDQDAKAPPPPARAPQRRVDDDVLDLAEVATAVTPGRADLVMEHEDVAFRDADAAFDHEEVEEQGMDAADPAERLISTSTDASVANAFGKLAHTVLTQNARTLEDLVREMLKPMLKAWLDDNLPGLVERLVRAEIERVARGR